MALESKGAQTPKLTPEKIHRIVSLLRMAVAETTAFRESGVSYAQHAAWKRYARMYREDPEKHPNHVWYAQLFDEVDVALAQAEVQQHGVVAVAAVGKTHDERCAGNGRCGSTCIGEPHTFKVVDVQPDVEHAKWLLTRRFASNYAGKQTVDVTTDGQPLPAGQTQVNIAVRGVVILPPEEPLEVNDDAKATPA